MIERRTIGDHTVILEIAPVGCSPKERERLHEKVVDHCDEIAFDDGVRVVVLLYSGSVFEDSPGNLDRYGHGGPFSLTDAIARLPQPVIAAIRGDAIGPGLEVALACDLRLGTAGACFGLSQVRTGQIPHDGGTQRLGRLIGQAKALEMLLTGDLVDTEEALRVGLLNRVVPRDALTPTAEQLACDMATRAPVAVSYVKEALRNGMDLTLDQGLRMELDLYLLLFSTHDRTEGVKAFLEKRAAKFTGA